MQHYLYQRTQQILKSKYDVRYFCLALFKSKFSMKLEYQNFQRLLLHLSVIYHRSELFDNYRKSDSYSHHIFKK
ncbi:hypothetical protein T4D_12316 [Trichinella pseudospiralis]|uniref:Uncharacterized protein n=1 Tax=Trichinella pseudospiralis TaxID=6337 RepID=A0A0V1G119_TRIPS|nr:hypothetical protein T4D_12316 [Trichinella pseudospiralis]